MDVVDGGAAGGGGGARAAGGDDGGAALGDGRHEVVLHPFVIDEGRSGLAFDRGERDVGNHGRGMVAPDGHVLDRGDGGARLFGELRHGAVLVEAEHSGEALRIKIRGVLHGDPGIGVARIADDEHLDVAAGGDVEGLALLAEDGGVGLEQVRAFHAGTARTGADEERDLAVAEGLDGILNGAHAGQKREGAVGELHHHALEGGGGGRVGAFEQREEHGLVRAKHGAGGDAEERGVADLAGGAGHRHANGCFHGFFSLILKHSG